MNFFNYLGERARLLKNKNYFAFILNCLLAPFGNAFVYIALSWHTQSHSESTGGIALLMLCLWGPTVILAPVAGWLVDFGSPKIVALLSNLGTPVAPSGASCLSVKRCGWYYRFDPVFFAILF